MILSPLVLSKLYHASHKVVDLLSESQQVKIASAGRKLFMQQFACQKIAKPVIPADELALDLWGINFRSPIMNSAGMFKNGEAYDVVAALGAGAYIGGTSTANPRSGNSKHGINLPFITFPRSEVAINWLGLPNLGDEILAQKIITPQKIAGCPIGWSLMRSPDFTEAEGLNKLIASLWKYHDNAQIDFIEINESCPNVKNGGGSIIPRLEIISREFLAKRSRHLPVVVKLSNDLTYESVEQIIDALVRLNFDGINLGNTSTNYGLMRSRLLPEEKELYDYFTHEFGGGVSGSCLKDNSLQLCTIAAERLAQLKPVQEFHIIRSGGVNCWEDVRQSQQHGAKLSQWYTGFFSQYNKLGNQVYCNLYSSNQIVSL